MVQICLHINRKAKEKHFKVLSPEGNLGNLQPPKGPRLRDSNFASVLWSSFCLAVNKDENQKIFKNEKKKKKNAIHDELTLQNASNNIASALIKHKL